jgi:hypothetical protein
LPSCLADHPDILDFIRVSEESPSSLHVIPGYSEASKIVQDILQITKITPIQMVGIENCPSAGVASRLYKCPVAS